MSRKEQIFKCCEYLKEQGAEKADDFSLRNIQDVCEKLKFPRGNKEYVLKYRDLWLEECYQSPDIEGVILFGDKEKGDALTPNLGSSPYSMQKVLERALLEEAQKVRNDLKLRYDKKIIELESDNRQLKHKASELQRNDSCLKADLKRAQEKIDAFDISAKQLAKKAEDSSSAYLTQSIELSRARQEIRELKKKKDHKVDGLKEQINLLKTQLEEGRTSLKESQRIFEQANKRIIFEYKQREELYINEINMLHNKVDEQKIRLSQHDGELERLLNKVKKSN